MPLIVRIHEQRTRGTYDNPVISNVKQHWRESLVEWVIL